MSTRLPSPRALTPTYADANYRYPGWLSADGVEAWTYSQTVLWRTVDGWASTQTVHAFTLPVIGVRQLPSGELLVSLQGDAGNAGELWRSTGYSRATGTASSWSKVLTCSNVGTFASGDWCMWVDQAVAVVCEYGAKTAGGLNARGAYVSVDDGATWRQIMDRPGSGLHLHGCAYDAVGDMVWIVAGDDEQGVAYSSDWRNTTPTWTWVDSVVQPVGVFPMADRIVLGSDDANNGPYRIERDDLTRVVPAFRVTTDASLTVLAGQPYRRSPGHPLLLPYGPVPGSTLPSHLLATWDGLAWWRVYSDANSYNGLGLVTAHGPDQYGLITGFHNGTRYAAGTRVTFTAPTWAEGTM